MMSGKSMALRLLALLSLLPLAGCWWMGPILYAPVPNAPAPVTDGRWRHVQAEAGKPPETGIVRLHRLADGSFTAQDEGHPAQAPDDARLVFVPLAAAGRSLWILEVMATDEAHQPVALFGLAEPRGALLTLDQTLECNGNEELVRAAGGRIDTYGTAQADVPAQHLCRFDDRAALERALRAYAHAHPRLTGATMERIGD